MVNDMTDGVSLASVCAAAPGRGLSPSVYDDVYNMMVLMAFSPAPALPAASGRGLSRRLPLGGQAPRGHGIDYQLDYHRCSVPYYCYYFHM